MPIGRYKLVFDPITRTAKHTNRRGTSISMFLIFGLVSLIFADCAVNTPFCPSSQPHDRQPEPNDTWQTNQTYPIAWNGQYNTFVTAKSVDIYLFSLKAPTNNPSKIFTAILASQEMVEFTVPNVTSGSYEVVIVAKDQQPSSGSDTSIPISIKQTFAKIDPQPLPPVDNVINNTLPMAQDNWRWPVIITASVVAGVLVLSLIAVAFYIHRRKQKPNKLGDVAGPDTSLDGSTDMDLVTNTFKNALGKSVEEEDFGVLIRSLDAHSPQLDNHNPSSATIVDDK